MLRYIMGPVFKLAKISRTVEHGGKMIVDLSISEKYRGMLVTESTEASSAEPVATNPHLYKNRENVKAIVQLANACGRLMNLPL